VRLLRARIAQRWLCGSLSPVQSAKSITTSTLSPCRLPVGLGNQHYTGVTERKQHDTSGSNGQVAKWSPVHSLHVCRGNGGNDRVAGQGYWKGDDGSGSQAQRHCRQGRDGGQRTGSGYVRHHEIRGHDEARAEMPLDNHRAYEYERGQHGPGNAGTSRLTCPANAPDCGCRSRERRTGSEPRGAKRRAALTLFPLNIYQGFFA